MSVTIRDIAEQLNVSKATVSRVLNDRDNPFISDATKRRVLATAEEMGYVPNRLISGLWRGKTQMLSLVMPGNSDPFSATMVQGFEQECFERDQRLILASCMNDIAMCTRQVRLALEHRVDGLAILALQVHPDALCWAGQMVWTKLPCVVLDDRTFSGDMDTVISDDRHGAAAAVRHLIDIGHKRIGHLAGGSRISTGVDRESAYREALNQAGIEVDERLVAGSYESTERSGELAMAFMELDDPPTAIFAASDYMAAYAMRALSRHGIRVPEDVAVVGYGDTVVARCMDMTTVDQHPLEMGRVACTRLLARITDRSLAVENTVVPTELVVRGTCGGRTKS